MNNVLFPFFWILQPQCIYGHIELHERQGNIATKDAGYKNSVKSYKTSLLHYNLKWVFFFFFFYLFFFFLFYFFSRFTFQQHLMGILRSPMSPWLWLFFFKLFISLFLFRYFHGEMFLYNHINHAMPHVEPNNFIFFCFASLMCVFVCDDNIVACCIHNSLMFTSQSWYCVLVL